MGLQQLGLVDQLLQGEHGQQRYGKLGNDQDAGHGTELGIEGYIVEEEVCERHEVTTPRQQHGEDGDSQQGPLERSLDDEQSQHEEHEHKGTHIDRSCRHGLLAPVLANLLIDAQIVVVGMLHGQLVLCHRHGGSTLDIGNEQGPRLVDAIAPLGDIVTVQTTGGLVAGILLHQLTLATHGLLAIEPGMIEVGEVQADANGSTYGTHRQGLQHMLPATRLRVAETFNDKGNDHGEDDEEVVVGHLHVVGQHLQA